MSKAGIVSLVAAATLLHTGQAQAETTAPDGQPLTGRAAAERMIGNTLIASDPPASESKQSHGMDLLYFAPDGTGRMRAGTPQKDEESIKWLIDEQGRVCLITHHEAPADAICAAATITGNHVALQYDSHNEKMTVTLVDGNPYGL